MGIIGGVIIQYQYFVVIVILLMDGGKQGQNILRLVTGRDKDGYFIGVMLAYARQFGVRQKIEQGYRKAQDQKNKNDEQSYDHFISISVCCNLLAS
jgi:hypothetical protein